MEKLVSRPSGGGAKLGTLDMQSYLEVMGRQLAEIQAQHHQFYASRQERLGRGRNNEGQLKLSSSESNSASRHHQGTLTPPGEQEVLSNERGQQASPSVASSSGLSDAAARSSTGSQGGARRSLSFPDDSGGSPASDAAPQSRDTPAGVRGAATHGAQANPEVRAYNSSPPIAGLGDACAPDTDRAGRGVQPPRPTAERPSGSRPPKRPGVSTPESMSLAGSHSVSPSSVSQRRSTANTETPSVSSAHTGAAASPSPAGRVVTDSADTSPTGPYAVYDVTGVASISYTSPQTHDGDGRDDRSPSPSAKKLWHESTPGSSSAFPSPEVFTAGQGAYGASPSAPSADSSTLGVHGPRADVEGSVSDGDGLPFPLALAGKAFDGIDSEEDPDQEATEQEASAGQHRSSTSTGAFVGVTGREDGGKAGGRLSVPRLEAVAASSAGSRPESRAEARPTLMVASLGTEEALRVLLATPRFGTAGGSIPVAASIDVEGLEVPDDVLAALAKTDGMDLDAALGAAMAATMREQLANQVRGPPPVRAEGKAQATSHRHRALGPGALTASPAAVPSAVAARGLDGSSLRSIGNATTGRSAGTPSTAAGVSPSNLRGHQGVQSPHHANEASKVGGVEESLDLESVDMLSRTIEISPEALGPTGALLRGSAAYAAMAMAAQRAAAQQHAQPVLYSLAPRQTGADGAGDEGSKKQSTADGDRRRSTADGGSRRSTVDGESRRITGDGSALKPELAGASDSEHMAVAGAEQQAAVPPPAFTSGVGCEEQDVTSTPPHRTRAAASTATASPTGTRQGGLDGDVVLYGSPNQRTAGSGKPDAAPSGAGGGAASPYTAAQPPYHAGSRLKRNSRNTIEDIGLSPRPECEPDGCSAAGGSDEPAAAVPVHAEAGYRPWSAASSRRQITTPGSFSGPNSGIHLDLSLTQAAAAVASAGGRPGTGSAVSSPTVSARQMRVPTPGPLQVPPPLHHPYHPQQQQQHGAHPPVYSSFAISAVSPNSAHVTSYDLSVDEAGQPFSPTRSPADAASASCARPKAQSSDGRTSQGSLAPPQQPAAPPLASFARAAALAAAADVGLSAPPPHPPAAEVRSRRLSSGTSGRAATDVSADPSQSGAEESTNAAAEGQRGAEAAGGSETRSQTGVYGGCAGAGRRQGAGDSLHDLHGEHGQSPGPPSVAASAAKLSQLKARRQQQWQSQFGLAPELGAPETSAAAPEPPSGQQHSTPVRSDQGQRRVTGEQPVGWETGSLRGPAPSESVVAPSVSSAAASPLLPEAVAAAITRAANLSEGQSAFGELNLGHGINGLSVAIEAGQVKWAWQTDVKGKAAAGGAQAGGAHARGGDSPGRAGSRESSPGASPSGAAGPVRESGSEWALQHLPAPQWQRHGHVPAGTIRQQQEREFRESKEQQREPDLAAVLRNAQLAAQLPQGAQYPAMRRHSEYSVLQQRQAAKGEGAGGAAQPYQYAQSAGGSAAQAQPQLQPQFRSASASDAGTQGSKAMALLRLKQQSILRHGGLTEQSKEHRESEMQGGTALRREYQPQQVPAAPPPLQESSLRSYSAEHRTAALRAQRRASAPRLPHAIAEDEEALQYGSRAWAQATEDGGADRADRQGQPKTFLRRRSAKVQARKVDWSYVKPRTNSRNPDYYGDNNGPDVVLRTHVSPLTSPKGGVAKPSIGGPNFGVRPRKPAAKVPPSPTDEEKSVAAAAATAAARRRTNSNIPSAPGAGGSGGGAGERRGTGAVAPPGAARGNGLSPLDDLLAHVNTLLRDFDRSVI